MTNSQKQLIGNIKAQVQEQARLLAKAAGLPNPQTLQDLDKFYCDHLYFVTITFRKAAFSSLPITDPGSHLDAKKQVLKRWYLKLCRHLLGNAWKRKKSQQPLVFYALDDEGSKLGGVNWNRPTNVHVHAVMLIHPDTQDVTSQLNFSRTAGHVAEIDGIKVVPFDPEGGSLYNLIDYVFKAVRPKWDHEVNWDVLPDQPKEREYGLERETRNFKFKTLRASELCEDANMRVKRAELNTAAVECNTVIAHPQSTHHHGTMQEQLKNEHY